MGEHVGGSCENMDVLFYEQSALPVNGFSRYDKNALRLNLEGHHPSVVQEYRGNGKLGIYENSPELSLFKMVSPELEKFIAKFEKILASVQNPKSPTQAKNTREGNHSVKQQHEAYVQGFAEALQQIHDRQQQQVDHLNKQNTTPVSSGTKNTWAEPENTVNNFHTQIAVNETSYDIRNPPYAGVTTYEHHELYPTAFTAPVVAEAENFEYAEDTLKPQAGSVLPLPPIDLELQEIVKRERKKQKNRVAASKCRKKKLEREAQLEVRVQQLKDKNIELNAVANALRQQVSELKQRVLEHVAFGCQLPSIASATF
ncbi:Transcription factor AP-1 [Stylophora pistillata]|uniref:Transcription factor AP-1 n=1 Tax=Stylophora pistillata TaxID=50429 RepID=A0A2B4RD04_STYPI|nr:Transcription factor AP-1 [Stylophora pistillata]